MQGERGSAAHHDHSQIKDQNALIWIDVQAYSTFSCQASSADMQIAAAAVAGSFQNL